MTEPKTHQSAKPDSDLEEAIERARADVAAGRTVAYDEVRRWLMSIGTDEELPAPTCE